MFRRNSSFFSHRTRDISPLFTVKLNRKRPYILALDDAFQRQQTTGVRRIFQVKVLRVLMLPEESVAAAVHCVGESVLEAVSGHDSRGLQPENVGMIF
jgi:hypothetical protein